MVSELYVPKISTIHEPYSSILPPPYNTSLGVPTSFQSCKNVFQGGHTCFLGKSFGRAITIGIHSHDFAMRN
jgi:hypothetical protein